MVFHVTLTKAEDGWFVAECIYVRRMLRVIRIRNVPDNMHRKLKARAAMAEMSLSDFMLAEMRALAERPSITELRERLRRSSPAAGFSPAAAESPERKIEYDSHFSIAHCTE
jgi:plasmid stability protein